MPNDHEQSSDRHRNGETIPADFRRPVHCLLGLPIDALSRTEVISRIRFACTTRSRCWLSTSNVQYLIATQTDEYFRDSVILSDISVADGMPLIWIARLLGLPIKERLAGADLFECLLRGEGGALKIFFFGGPDGVAELACKRLNALSGPLTCVGYASPGFGTVEQMSATAQIEQINQSGADFLVVALGARKGQAWIERNLRFLNIPVISHLGAVVNFVAGTLTRAPVWLQNIGLEWLWRIKEEPRLRRRYWDDSRMLLQLLVTRVIPGILHRSLNVLDGIPIPAAIAIAARDANGSTRGIPNGAGLVSQVTLSGSWSEPDMFLLRRAFENLSREQGDIELDVSGVHKVNGTFIALTMLLYASQSKRGCTLTLLSAGKALRRIFRLHCAEFLLDGVGKSPALVMR